MTLWTVSVRRLQHNLYAYYGLNPLFKTAVVNGQKVDFRSLQFGIIFIFYNHKGINSIWGILPAKIPMINSFIVCFHL
jgi:hypothetical protein